MKVTFAAFEDSIASTRLRALIPQAELAKLGIKQGRDVLVIGKHGWKWDSLKGYGKIVFDVCDDHFGGSLDAHYRESCQRADAVTCSTPVLADIIRRETGRDAVVIGEPYEQPERSPRVGESLLWFGHRSNLKDLQRVLPELGNRPLRIVTNEPATDDAMVWPWSPQTMDRAFDEAGLVIIPTGAKQAKSANRAVESIRRGLFVIANPLPAYAELGIWQGDIKTGIEWALAHQNEVLHRIRTAQDYVREKFSPQVIAKQWLRLLEATCGTTSLPQREVSA